MTEEEQDALFVSRLREQQADRKESACLVEKAK